MAEANSTTVGLRSSQTSSNGNSSTAPVNSPPIFLAPMPNNDRAESKQLRGILGRLARFFHLNIYGDSLLVGCAVSEMKMYALMLAVITCFDFMAWSFLWNLIFLNRAWQVGWITPLAMLLGAMFASMVFFYERSWITRDISHGILSGKTLTTAVGLFFRFAMIGLAAYIQAQPIEFITFDSAIQRRIHDESVRSEALNRLRALEEAERKSLGGTGLVGTVEQQDAAEAKQQLETAREQDGILKGKVNSAQKALDTATRRLGEAQTYNRTHKRQRNVQNLSQQVINATSALNEAKNNYQGNEAKLNGAVEDSTKKTETLVQKQNSAEQDVARIENWIAQIRNQKEINPNKEIVEADTTRNPRWTFKDDDYDFFNRMSLISDLRFGRAPRWIGASDDDRQKIKDKFGFSDSEESKEQVKNQAETTDHWWLGILGVSIFIPIMIFIVKFFMREELKDYYSRSKQRNALNYEAFPVRVDADSFHVSD